MGSNSSRHNERNYSGEELAANELNGIEFDDKNPNPGQILETVQKHTTIPNMIEYMNHMIEFYNQKRSGIKNQIEKINKAQQETEQTLETLKKRSFNRKKENVVETTNDVTKNIKIEIYITELTQQMTNNEKNIRTLKGNSAKYQERINSIGKIINVLNGASSNTLDEYSQFELRF